MILLLGVFAVLLFNVKITVGNGEKFFWKISVCGITVPKRVFERFFRSGGHIKKSEKTENKKKKSDIEDGNDKKIKKDKKEKSAKQVILLLTELAKVAANALPKGFRFRLKKLRITAGGEDAAQTALAYGKFYAAAESLFALFDGYRGLFYGFRAKKSDVIITVDYEKQKSGAEFEMTVSFFVWQLVFIAIRIGVAAIVFMLKNAEDDE